MNNIRREEISDCEGLSIRASNLLYHHGIQYVDELVKLSSREILSWRNCGKRTLNEIRNLLCSKKLSLADEVIDVDVKKIILIDLPDVLQEVKNMVGEAINKLDYFTFKLDTICRHVKNAKPGALTHDCRGTENDEKTEVCLRNSVSGISDLEKTT